MQRMLAKVRVLVPVLLITSHASAESKESRWSAPVHLPCDVNSEWLETGPAISRDGLSLFFGSNRPGGEGSFDIWVSQRESVDDPWGTPRSVAALNTPGIDNIPVLSRDQHWLYFNSNRHSGSTTDVDIYVAYREDIRDDFGWGEPRNLDELRPGVNTNGFDGGATLIERGDRRAVLYFSRGASTNVTDIYVSEPEGRTYATSLVPELSSAVNDQRPSIRPDGREIFVSSNRTPSEGGNDVWVSTRSGLARPWNAPVNLGPPVNGPFNDLQAHIAQDAESLYFISDRPGYCTGNGPEPAGANFDLYVSFREDEDREGEDEE